MTGGNLPDNEMLVYLSGADGGPIPQLTPAQSRSTHSSVTGIATAIGTHGALELDRASSANTPDLTDPITGVTGKDAADIGKAHAVKGGFEFASSGVTLYVATPDLLSHYGIAASSVDPTADVISSRTDLAGQTLLIPGGEGPRGGIPPKVQSLPLPKYSSDPNTLLTSHAMQKFGLQYAPVAWLLHASQPLTSSQIDAARKLAAGAGLTIETRPTVQSLTRLRNDATAVGILVALGVLAMTVGLIRSETAGDLRTLTATGAGRSLRVSCSPLRTGSTGMLVRAVIVAWPVACTKTRSTSTCGSYTPSWNGGCRNMQDSRSSGSSHRDPTTPCSGSATSY